MKASTWLTHLDYDWDSPVWSHWWQALSRQHTLVRYDERGCGLSDWDVDSDSYSLEAWVRDLETVVDALGLERFALLGISQGGPIAITYAARHPERVSHVVVFGTCARATWAKATDEQRRELAALGELIKVSWGSDQPGFRQVYDARFLPDGPIETWRAFDRVAAPIHVAAKRPSALARFRRARLRRGGPPAPRSHIDPARHRRPGLVAPRPVACYTLLGFRAALACNPDPRSPHMIIDLIVYDGIDELDALGPLEVLRNAERLGADMTSRLVTRQAQPVVRGSYGLRFTPDGVYQPGEAEIVVVPGGGWVGRADVGAWGESQRGEWLPLLAEAAGTARVVAGVCTGTMLLAHAGVVGGRRAATHHDAWHELEATGALVVKDRVVDDGNLVTSGGVTSGIDLALWLVHREVSAESAGRVATRIEYVWQGPRAGSVESRWRLSPSA